MNLFRIFIKSLSALLIMIWPDFIFHLLLQRCTYLSFFSSQCLILYKNSKETNYSDLSAVYTFLYMVEGLDFCPVISDIQLVDLARG